jgi:hypothetical protein
MRIFRAICNSDSDLAALSSADNVTATQCVQVFQNPRIAFILALESLDSSGCAESENVGNISRMASKRRGIQRTLGRNAQNAAAFLRALRG